MAKTNVPPETEEELALVKTMLLVPVALDVLEHDRKIIQSSGMKMSVLYARALERLQDLITQDAVRIRRQLRERGIKIVSQERTTHCLEAQYLCRGYVLQFSMLWSLVRAEVETMLCRLVAERLPLLLHL